MPETLSPDSVKIPSPKTADDINDLFKELDKEPDKSEREEEKPAPTTTREKDEGEDEEPDDDDDLELVDDEDIEKLDLAKQDEDFEVDAPPRKKEILKKYPELYKDFPFLEKMMYRDKQFTEMFGSLDDARELAGKAEVFSQFENQLLSGNTEEILKEVKDTDQKAFNLIVDEYLPTLWKVDKEAYHHVTGNLNRRLIMEMVQEANDTGNDDLKQAALLVNQFVFGTSKFTAPARLVEKNAEADKAKSEIENERLSFVKERFETARDELQSQVDNTLRATISEYIDPRGNMTSYVKKNAVADAMKILTAAIADDPNVAKNLDRLWRGSFDNKFSRESLNNIRKYYLSKAKGNLKNAIMKARAEALKNDSSNSRHKETDDETEQEDNSRRESRKISTGRPSQPKKNEMKKGESVADFFLRD